MSCSAVITLSNQNSCPLLRKSVGGRVLMSKHCRSCGLFCTIFYNSFANIGRDTTYSSDHGSRSKVYAYIHYFFIVWMRNCKTRKTTSFFMHSVSLNIIPLVFSIACYESGNPPTYWSGSLLRICVWHFAYITWLCEFQTEWIKKVTNCSLTEIIYCVCCKGQICRLFGNCDPPKDVHLTM